MATSMRGAGDAFGARDRMVLPRADRHPVLRRGIVVGLLGAAAVALWFFVLDLVAGQPFHTPAALGSALLLGASGPDQVRITAGIVSAYTAVHCLTFAVAGIALVWISDQLARVPQMWLLVFFTAVVAEALLLGSVLPLGLWVLQAKGWPAVLAANMIALAVMGLALWRLHPELGRKGFWRPVDTAI